MSSNSFWPGVGKKPAVGHLLTQSAYLFSPLEITAQTVYQNPRTLCVLVPNPTTRGAVPTAQQSYTLTL